MSNIYRTSQCHLVAEQHFRYITRLYLGTAKLHTRKAASVYNSDAHSCVGELSKYVYVNERELCEDDNMHELGFLMSNIYNFSRYLP